jgi:demethylmenaquinone methyltransferase / 2-methoxy-6-polyprenyl-1,4-benzoquinol methylase
MATTLSERNRAAQNLFAPIAASYDRYARLLSLGQDPRWRRVLVSCVPARPDDRILDVACGTGAVARELAARYGCTVVGIDQSEAMVGEAGRRTDDERIGYRLARAEDLPFPDNSFDALTFTYLLRYVDDPCATLRELARVVRPGGRMAMLEFAIPENAFVRPLWSGYVGAGLPLVGALVSPGWREVGRFLGPSIKAFWARFPLEELLRLWAGAGIVDVRHRVLSLGGGIVVSGSRGT